MWSRPKPAPAPWTAAEQLEALPLRNAAATVVEDEPRRLVLRVALVHRGLLRMVRNLLHLRDHRLWELREVDLLLHRWCDGRTTVEDLIVRMAREERLGWNESRALVLSYLMRQVERGLLVVGKPVEN